MFFKTDAPAGTNLYTCTTANSWSVTGLPALGGDASGTQQALRVTGIQGRGISAAAPADQNVLRWNATTGQWEPGTMLASGTAAPPGTCVAGGLYLRSDPVNNIQQLYVCSNTNTWTMTSARSGLAANRPANCVAGQTWLSTDTGAMTYCSATGTPGTWSATLAGPQGPSGPQGPAGISGNTIWNGAGTPAAGIGSNGDFYLNTTVSCLYGPKASGAWPGACTPLTGSPNFSGASGNSTMISTYLAAGLTKTSVESGQTSLPSIGNLQTGDASDNYLGGLFNPANYGNLAGVYARSTFRNGRNSADNSDKKSIFGIYQYVNLQAGGQKFGYGETVTGNGVGDTFGQSNEIYSGAYASAPGDEGVVGDSSRIYEMQSHLTITTTGLTKTSCAVTSLAADVAKSQYPADIKTVAVNGSTSACQTGDWLTVGQGVFESGFPGCQAGSCTPSDINVETFQLTGVGSNTISALFQQPHTGCATAGTCPVAPAPVLTDTTASDLNPTAPHQWGQGRIVVDMTATPVTGTASVNGHTVTWASGPTWSNSMVGGNSNLPGCISLAANTSTSGPFSSAPLLSWYPIQSLTSTTITLSRPWSDQYGNTSAAAGNYTIRPCARIGALALSYGSTSNAVTGIVLESTNFNWSAPRTVEQTISPYSLHSEVNLASWTWYGPVQNAPSMYRAYNLGNTMAYDAFEVPQSAMDTPTVPSYTRGIWLAANTQQGAVVLSGQDMGGTGITMSTYNTGAGDPKKISWNARSGNASAGIYPDTTSGLFTMQTYGNGLRLVENDNSGSIVLDYSAPEGTGQTYTLKAPAENATLLTNADIGPGYVTRTLPASVGTEVDIGSFNGGQSGGNAGYHITVTIGYPYSVSKTYIVTTGYLALNNAWAAVTPLSVLPDTSGSGADFALDMKSDGNGATWFRLRKTAGTSSAPAKISIFQFGTDATATFNPSTSTSTVSAPTAFWPSSVISQSGGALYVQGAGGNLKLDLSGYTGAHTVAAPDYAGTLMLLTGASTGSGTAALGANSPASTLSAPYTWIQSKAPDGSTVYIPAWK